jgi:glucose-6-phosphate isomerase
LAKDASVWTNEDEAKWLGWLDSVEVESSKIQEYKDFAEDIKNAGFTDVLLMGMGGSSRSRPKFFRSLSARKFSRSRFDRSGADQNDRKKLI